MKVRVKDILIEGWRGINQSYAMVNQYQLLELAQHKELSVYHHDLPFASKQWNTTNNNPGFAPAMESVIQGFATPRQGSYDAVFRIASPFARSTAKAKKTLTFMTAEYGLGPENFPATGSRLENITEGDASIVTPSHWSHMKLVEYGFPKEKIHVVPHGVNTSIFYPMPTSDRNTLRKTIGLGSDDFVFLNLGAMSVNKGIDLVLRAFFAIRKKYPRARLLLKDERNLYKLSGAAVVQETLRNFPQANVEELLASIKLISVTLPVYEMRHLYCMADVYVSPYRAEGFNLPVIESIACGTPVVVTAGGATDDYCNPEVASAVPSTQVHNSSRNLSGTGYTLEPDLDALIAAMEQHIDNPVSASNSFATGRQKVCEDYSWSRCTERLTTLF